MTTRRSILLACAAGLVVPATLAAPAAAQDFPQGPVTLVVPFSPGGSNDIVARQLAKQLGEIWDEPIVVENRPGAGATIGAEHVANTEPDGQTIMIASVTFTMNPAVQQDIPFDPREDFTPIAMLGRVPLMIGARPDIEAETPEELFEYIRDNPGTLNYGATGVGSIQHFAGELLKQAEDLDIQAVQYPGGAPAMADVMGSIIEFSIGSMTQILPNVEDGRMKGIAVTSAERSQAAPDVPTLMESGVEDYELYQWWGILAPAGVPDETVAALNGAINEVLETDEMRDFLAQEGADASPMEPDEFAAFMDENFERWQRVADEAGIEAE